MKLIDNLDFQPMLITDVFESIKAAKNWFDLSKARQKGDRTYPYVARSGGWNGIGCYLPHQGFDAPNDGNAITIGVSTSTVFYQPVRFYTSKEIQVLRHPRLTAVNGPVLVAILRSQMVKFRWGNGASLDRLHATRIMVPVTTIDASETTVDWDGLDRLGIELRDQALTRTQGVLRTDVTEDDNLPVLRFGPVYVMRTAQHDGLFIAHKGKRLISADRKAGNMPFIGAARTNNSIVSFSDTEPLFPGGWVTLIYNGDGGTGHAKYQPMPFNASDDVIALEPISEKATEEALLMLASSLTHQCVSKFSFGYKLKLQRLQRQKIMVPVTIDNAGNEVVDWDGMIAYGRALRVRAERQLGPISAT